MSRAAEFAAGAGSEPERPGVFGHVGTPGLPGYRPIDMLVAGGGKVHYGTEMSIGSGNYSSLCNTRNGSAASGRVRPAPKATEVTCPKCASNDHIYGNQ